MGHPEIITGSGVVWGEVAFVDGHEVTVPIGNYTRSLFFLL